VTVAFASGAVAGFLLREVVHTSLVGAQRAGILVAAGVAVLAAWWPAGRTSGSSRRRPDRRVERARRADDGRTPLRERVRSTGPLVLFGVAFAGLVFVAQAATWHSQSRRHPWILALQPDVQAGWTWALVAVLGAVAMVAASARGFGGQLGLVADRTPLTAPGRMALEAQAARRRVMGRVVLWALFGAAVTLVTVVVLMAVSTSFADVVSRNTALVIEIVGPGLMLVAWAAFDASILVAMRRPAAPAVAAVAGVAVAAVTAVVLARTAPDWSPAAGFDAGAVVCWALTSAGARRVLRTPDVALAARG
jgi:hypothetical protein